MRTLLAIVLIGRVAYADEHTQLFMRRRLVDVHPAYKNYPAKAALADGSSLDPDQMERMLSGSRTAQHIASYRAFDHRSRLECAAAGGLSLVALATATTEASYGHDRAALTAGVIGGVASAMLYMLGVSNGLDGNDELVRAYASYNEDLAAQLHVCVRGLEVVGC